MSYLLIIALVVCSGLYAIYNVCRLNRNIHLTSSIDSVAIRLSEEIAENLYRQTGFEEKYLVSRDPDFFRQFMEIHADISRKIFEYDKIAEAEDKRRLLNDVRDLHARHRALFEGAAFKKPLSRDGSGYNTLKEEIVMSMDIKLRRLASLSALDREEKLQLSEDISTSLVRVITITESGAILLVILVSLFNTKTITTPIRLLQDKTRRTALGDFGRPLTISSPPEIKELSDSFNQMCERLQELDQMKLDFISHLSHELRTPLTAIKESSSMLLEGVFAKLPEKQEELHSIIKDECERLIRSINRTLDLSRMEAGMMEFYFEEADIVPLIDRNISKLSPIAQRSGIQIRTEFPPGLPWVRIDQEKIEQAIENLLGNSLKFTAPGGAIFISLSRDAKSLRFSITDTGCGIPGEQLEEVFNKFKRVDEHRSTVRGTGLGLAISKHIIKAHGGRIWVESKPGEGSAFFFSLPLSQ